MLVVPELAAELELLQETLITRKVIFDDFTSTGLVRVLRQ